MSRRVFLLLALAAACGSDSTDEPAATTVVMRFDRPTFFDAPFPSDDLLDSGGHPRLTGFPNRLNKPVVADALTLIHESAGGFSLAGGVFFHLDGPVDAAKLPGIDASTTATATVFLLDTASGKRTPLEVSFTAEAAVYAPENTLALVPVQGFPLRPRTLHAAVVMRALGDATGKPLGQSAVMRALAAGQRPAGLGDAAWTSYQKAAAALEAAGVDLGAVAGMTAFTTDDPAAGLAVWRAALLAAPLPTPKTPLMAREVFPDYCVYASTLAVPVYQKGEPPYVHAGGDFGATPAVDHTEDANVFITIPRKALPAGGMPIVAYLRQGGGGEDPLVERGRQDADGNTMTAGEGPARYFARAGYAGIIVDGPMAGRRNAGDDEEFALFNLTNGRALRDSIRQSALELILVANMLKTLSVDASSCPGGPGAAVRFDMDHLVIMGHSTGAWIAPIAMAHEPAYKAAILSGAGGSWIDNILYKQKPLVVAPLLALFLGDTPLASDPSVTLVQWAAEPADPQVYAPLIRASGRHILMEQGIVDHYILPRIANSVSLPLGLSLGGEPRDADVPENLSLVPLLAHAGSGQVTLPARGNRDGVTAVVVQHAGDGIQDAHEVAFQTEAPKHEYRCFLETFLRGTPQVVAGTTADAPCDR